VTARVPETYQWLLVPSQATPQAAVEWQALRLSGQDALAVRASKKLKGDELLITGFAPTRLRMELDRVPLWRGDHVAVRQVVEDFGRYLYLPRLKGPEALLAAMRDGLTLLLWHEESFAYADNFDEAAGRYAGLRCGKDASISTDNMSGLLVKPEVARKQQEKDASGQGKGAAGQPGVTGGTGAGPDGPSGEGGTTGPDTPPILPASPGPRRFHGSVTLDTARVGRDASRIAEEVISHLSGLVGANVTVTLEIEAEIPSGAPDHVVRTVTENSRTLKFTTHGFEKD
jgi:hypothetical protein